MSSPPSPRTALVLSGGGIRGAYEVGVVRGMVEVLGLGSGDLCPFRIFAGTSIGAINAAFLASHASNGDMAVGELAHLWEKLRLDAHLRLRVAEHIPILKRFVRRASSGWSILDPRPLQQMVADGISWRGLRESTERGHIDAVIVAALNIATGRTTMFVQLAEGVKFRPSRDPLRAASEEPLKAEHILASAALPGLFPARRIGDAYFCDGGLRFNTPIAPAIRAGADRLVIIPVLRTVRPPRQGQTDLADYPRPVFLFGKLLNALLADPLARDLQMLERFNSLVDVLDQVLSDEQLERVMTVLEQTRGASYRRLETLVIRPSEDIGVIAGDYLRSERPGRSLRGLEGRLFRSARARTKLREADWASYLLFDGGFAHELIELGHRDAIAKTDDIREFFA